MEKRKEIFKLGLFVSLFWMCFSFSLQSQITIGSTSNPQKGVLLDLKEKDEVNGNADSDKGLVLPRVYLTNVDSLSPMLTGNEPGYDDLKPSYTGLMVYNVNPNAPFEKGIYLWNGTQWQGTNDSGITAKNGLTASGNTVQLGGDLSQNTVLNLNDYNLIFNRGHGNIGIGTSDPEAILHIENPNNEDPLILGNLKFISDAHNEIDDSVNVSDPNYYDLLISEDGVVRKAHLISPYLNHSVLYVLSEDTKILPGSATGNGTSGDGGVFLEWKYSVNLADHQNIILPEDGAYVFSFSLNGSWTPGTGTPIDANTFYISAFQNGTDASNMVDIAEIVASHTTYPSMSYSINLTVTGKAGDAVYFKLASYFPEYDAFTWTLLANKTTVIYWRL